MPEEKSRKKMQNLSEIIGNAIEKEYSTILSRDKNKEKEVAAYLKKFFLFRPKSVQKKSAGTNSHDELLPKIGDALSDVYHLGIGDSACRYLADYLTKYYDISLKKNKN